MQIKNANQWRKRLISKSFNSEGFSKVKHRRWKYCQRFEQRNNTKAIQCEDQKTGNEGNRVILCYRQVQPEDILHQEYERPEHKNGIIGEYERIEP